MKNLKIGILGLGYVGLPLCISFAKKYKVIGFDSNKKRVSQLNKKQDYTKEISKSELLNTKANFTNDLNSIAECNFYIIAVPTPINRNKKPDLSALILASKNVGQVIKKGDTVVFESTVYPGVTEEICIPEIEKISKLIPKKDFFYGYSPERINPGDKNRSLEKIIKITSGCTKKSAKFIDEVYRKVIKAGTHIASSVKVAEAAKVIENTQRDVNIALINELAMIFNLEGINTSEVLEAAKTKWNFIDFNPGLVGGHCIGVDPYYLTYRSRMLGHEPKLVLAGREINDQMGNYVSKKVKKIFQSKKINHKGNILIMGLTFKEDCPDIRNTKVVDIVKELSRDHNVEVFDPVANSKEAEKHLSIKTIKKVKKNFYDCVIIAVAHKEFRKLKFKELFSYGNKECIFIDIKSIFPKKERIYQI